ncbi:WLM domain-containing protein [Lactarius hatsudake]|nr:WLM domain-containing protein [Lactarius hatsudake]
MSTDIWVLSYEHLKGRPRSDDALSLLQKVASRVKPIMRSHSWRLPVLAEFFPDSPNLIDINMGEKILLRLRPAWDPDAFYSEEHVIHTMLHEALTHNVHGPHDQNFYEFLSRLEEEYYELKRSGYAGEGFFTNGRRLGEGIPQNIPAYLARQRALEAAEKRRRSKVTTDGPVRLGGGNLASLGLTPARAGLSTHSPTTAIQAADMRAADEKKCASGTFAQQEAEKAARDSHHNNAIDLTGDFDLDFSDDDIAIVSDDGPSTRAPHADNSARPRYQRVDQATTSTCQQRVPASLLGRQWTCPTCTLINGSHALQCGACLAPRPYQAPDPVAIAGWTCGVCGEEGMAHNLWTCRFCGSVKAESTFG